MNFRASFGLLIATAPAFGVTINESFEQGFGAWTPDSYIDDKGTLPFDPSVDRTTLRAQDGDWSVEFSARGDNDDGTFWLERAVDLPAGTHDITLRVYLWLVEPDVGGPWQVVATIREGDPETEADLRELVPGTTAGVWMPLTVSRTIALEAPGQVWVAFGLNVVFEVDWTYWFDSVEITVATTPPPGCNGDANGDGHANGADLSVLLAQFGGGVPPGSGADFNGDGLINGADLSVLLANFGCDSGG